MYRRVLAIHDGFMWSQEKKHVSIAEEYMEALFNTPKSSIGPSIYCSALGIHIQAILFESGIVWDCIQGWHTKRIKHVPF